MSNWILFGLIAAHAIAFVFGCYACDFDLLDYEQILPFVSQECRYIYNLPADDELRRAHFEESRLFGEYWDLFVVTKDYYDSRWYLNTQEVLHVDLYEYTFDLDGCDVLSREVDMVVCKTKFRVHMIMRLYDIAYAEVRFEKSKQEFMDKNAQYL